LTVRAEAPFTVYSVAFAYPRSPLAIPLRDPQTDQLLGLVPEWVAGARAEPAAYVRGARPVVLVVFARRGRRRGVPRAWRVGAAGGDGIGVGERAVTLRFGPSGRSAPVPFTLAAPLPRSIAVTRLRWRWHATGRDGHRIPLNASSHEVFTTWRPPGDPANWLNVPVPRDPRRVQPVAHWIYEPVVRWTCTWAAGLDDSRAICDAIIGRLRESGLRYGIGAYTVQDVLLAGGGYCGGFHRMFQAMAGSQGVHVARRAYLVDWRVRVDGRATWCALVVKHPGLNQSRPVEPASTFHDAAHPPSRDVRVSRVRQRRYRFWGIPGMHADGHCVCVLRHQGRYYLYDASFMDRAVALDWRSLPPINLRSSRGVAGLGNFKSAYLDGAVDHMLGSMDCAGRWFETIHPVPVKGHKTPPTRNGLTVRTGAIARRGRHLTFYWGP